MLGFFKRLFRPQSSAQSPTTAGELCPYNPADHDYEILLMYSRHAQVMLDVLAVGATARSWKARYGWDLPERILAVLAEIGPMIDPAYHFQNQNYGNPEP